MLLPLLHTCCCNYTPVCACVCRMKKAEIPCPEVVLLKKHILVMSFIGKDHVPAPKLKDAILGLEDLKTAYYQVLHVRILHSSPVHSALYFVNTVLVRQQ